MINSDNESIASSSIDQNSSGGARSNSSTDELSSTASNHTPGDDYKNELASRETKLVNRSRCLVLALIAVSATIAGVVTFLLTQWEERRTFKTEVSDSA